MKIKSLLFASFVFILFVSCDSTSTDESGLDTASFSASAKSIQAKPVERNISNSFVGTDTSTGSIGEGTMTHLGKFQGVQTTKLFQNNGDGTFNYESDDIITAANGDKLFTQTKIVLSFISALEASYVGGFTIVGGTGRFVGATGYLSVPNGVYVINGDTGVGTSQHNAVGKIKY